MELTLREIGDAKPHFEELLKKPMKATVSYKLALIGKELNVHLDLLNGEIQKLSKKYADENGLVFEGKEKEYRDELGELLDQKVDVNITPISIDSLGEIEIRPEIMFFLSFAFTE